MGPLEVMLFAGLAIPRLYPFSSKQVRVRETDREITRLCAWGDKVHRKDRPEREEARDLERTKIPIPACRTAS
jgi:hypothetical protein